MNTFRNLFLLIVTFSCVILISKNVYGQSTASSIPTKPILQPIKKSENFSLIVRKLLNTIQERSSNTYSKESLTSSINSGKSKLLTVSISKRLQANNAKKKALNEKNIGAYKKYAMQKIKYDNSSVSDKNKKYTPKRHSLKELRDRFIIKQQSEYSCSAAALATLLTYYFGDETSEIEILTMLEKQLTDEQRLNKHARGFSLFDLKNVAKQLGYQAGGFKLKLEQLKLLSSPVIVYVNPLDFEHFAVLRGIKGGRVFLADPSRGNLKMSIAQFADEWDGTVFVVGKKGEGDITSYPLQIAQSGLDQPELISVSRMHEIVSSSFAR